jgi:hypothetical protein
MGCRSKNQRSGAGTLYGKMMARGRVFAALEELGAAARGAGSRAKQAKATVLKSRGKVRNILFVIVVQNNISLNCP